MASRRESAEDEWRKKRDALEKQAFNDAVRAVEEFEFPKPKRASKVKTTTRHRGRKRR